jgi:putative tryptophan/tyrosine transport system substrate-binding protein
VRRRQFIAMAAATPAAWPLAWANAQNASIPVVGLLGARNAEFDVHLLAAFWKGMREIGYVENTNVTAEFRWAGGQYERLADLAEDLVWRQVAVIVTFGGTAPAQVAKAATATIPIVFVIGHDPVQLGFVESLARPGRNLTGVTNLFDVTASKQFGLLREFLPALKAIAFLVNPNEPLADADVHHAQAAARESDQKLIILSARTETEIEKAFATIVDVRADALVLGPSAFFAVQSRQLIELSVRKRIPALFWRREFPHSGGLMSYGADPFENYRQVGFLTGKILSGEKPSALPVRQSSKFELIINLKTARGLGLTVPPMLLARADEVIE